MKYIVLITLLTFAAFSSHAEEAKIEEYNLVIKDHVFTPSELAIPAGTKAKITIDNQDAAPEEFESKDLHREKVIKGRSKASVLVGPLKAGEYKFVGEYNEETAKGVIKVQ